MFCSKCGAEAGADARFCSKCGSSLQAADPGPPDRGEVEYIEAAIGPTNRDYYLPKFERFGSGGGYASWNWPALFVPLLWMLYRKMWLWATVYFFGTPVVLAALFTILLLTLPSATAVTVGWTIGLAALLIALPTYANALYYHTCRGRIAVAKAYPVQRREQLRRLWDMGGTSTVAWVVVLLLPVPFVPIIGILAAIAIPAYQDYTIRAQVGEGVSLAAAAKAAVAETFINTGAVPEDRIGGEVLSFTPYGVQRDAGPPAIVWRCGYGPVPAEATHEIATYETGTILPKYLPSACRPENYTPQYQ